MMLQLSSQVSHRGTSESKSIILADQELLTVRSKTNVNIYQQSQVVGLTIAFCKYVFDMPKLDILYYYIRIK